MVSPMNKDTNKTEVTFPSSDPSCQLCGDLTLPSSLSNNDDELLPAIVIVAGPGVSTLFFASMLTIFFLVFYRIIDANYICLSLHSTTANRSKWQRSQPTHELEHIQQIRRAHDIIISSFRSCHCYAFLRQAGRR